MSENEVKDEKPSTPPFSLKAWIIKHKLVLLSLVSTILFFYQGFKYDARQTAIEKELAESKQRVMDAENKAIHRTETAFALGINGLKQTNIVLENAVIEYRAQSILLLEHCKKAKCEIPIELAHVKEMPKYTPLAQTFFDVQQIMIQTELEGQAPLPKKEN